MQKIKTCFGCQLFIHSPHWKIYIFISIYQLINFEPSATRQIPLLVILNKGCEALSKAIESGDSDLGTMKCPKPCK